MSVGVRLAPPRATTLLTDPKRGERRYCDIRDWLVDGVQGRVITLAVIEAVPPYDFASSGLERVHGIAREVLARFDIPFAYVNVSALKRFATGNGRADKAVVMEFVREWGFVVDDDNQADATVLRVMGEMFLNGVGFGSVEQQAAMFAVEWPLFPNDPDWPWPYGNAWTSTRKQVTRKCGHKLVALKHADHWLHPFTVAVCDKPPTARK
jgi:hypothetical protein